MATFRRTTSRADFLDIVNDTYLYPNRKEARYALEAVSCAWRNWMLAMAYSVPMDTMRSLRIPGVGTIRIGWREYKNHAPRLVLRFSPVKQIRDILHKQSLEVYEKWKKENGKA